MYEISNALRDKKENLKVLATYNSLDVSERERKTKIHNENVLHRELEIEHCGFSLGQHEAQQHFLMLPFPRAYMCIDMCSLLIESNKRHTRENETEIESERERERGKFCS